MQDSILNYIKELLGVSLDEDSFDGEIQSAINNAFFTLHQLGIEPEEFKTTKKIFFVKGIETTWSEFLSNDNRLEFVKNYIFLKTKLQFENIANNVLKESINSNISELEFRLKTEFEC